MASDLVHVDFETSRQYYHWRIPRTLSHSTQLSSKPIQGVDTTSGGAVLRFSREVFTEDMATLSAAILTGLEVYTNPLAAGAPNGEADDARPMRLLEPTDDDLRIINASHSLRKLGAEDVRIFERFVISNAPTRNMLWFTDNALTKFAADFEQGRSRLLHHDKKQVVGRTFAADVAENKRIRGSKANWVRVREYVPNTPGHKETLDALDFGLYAFDSIGFAGGVIELKERPKGNGGTAYFLQVDFDPEELPALEAHEVSYVFLGAVFGAGNDRQQHAPSTATTPNQGSPNEPVEGAGNREGQQHEDEVTVLQIGVPGEAPGSAKEDRNRVSISQPDNDNPSNEGVTTWHVSG